MFNVKHVFSSINAFSFLQVIFKLLAPAVVRRPPLQSQLESQLPLQSESQLPSQPESHESSQLPSLVHVAESLRANAGHTRHTVPL